MLRLFIIIILYIVAVQGIAANQVDVVLPVIEYSGVQVASIPLPLIVREVKELSYSIMAYGSTTDGVGYEPQPKEPDEQSNL